MRISERGLQLIRNFEGLRLDAYKDAAGVFTIGYGHARAYPGQKITAERAEEILRADVARFEQAVNEAVTISLTQGQFDALVSFAFNVGARAMARSTLVEKLNGGDYTGAQQEFGRWVNAGGRRLEGLVRRRKAEAELFGSAPPEKPSEKPQLLVKGIPVLAQMNVPGEMWAAVRPFAAAAGLTVVWDPKTKTVVIE